MLRRLFLFYIVAVLIVGGGFVGGCGGGDGNGSSMGGSGTNSARRFQLADLQTDAATLNGMRLTLWRMDTTNKRAEGMMFLNDGDVRENEGMLFVFPDAQTRFFFMRNTTIPLDIAYLDADRRIVRIAPLVPLNETPVSSIEPARYAIEVRRGTLARIGATVGTTVEFDASIMARD